MYPEWKEYRNKEKATHLNLETDEDIQQSEIQ